MKQMMVLVETHIWKDDMTNNILYRRITNEFKYRFDGSGNVADYQTEHVSCVEKWVLLNDENN